jgi:predicted NAD/FAD-dependent oxidoreductase
MAVRTIDGRPVDIGAAYFTARTPPFIRVVERWQEEGLVEPWTDTLHLATPDGIAGTSTGPMRYRAPLGLRSLVEDLAQGLSMSNPDDVGSVGVVDGSVRVDQDTVEAAVLAMPGPQALDILSDDLDIERELSDQRWEPALALYARWSSRVWPELDGVFVNDSVILTFIADDGRRRGDDAPVLVAHAGAVLTAAHLDNPDAAAPILVDEVKSVLGIRADPDDALVKRWSLARPMTPHIDHHYVGERGVSLCGDGWHAGPRIETAYLSGHSLGRVLAARFGRELS